MPRLPDQLQTLVAQEGGGLEWTDESGPGSASEARRDRRDMSRLERLYTYALRHPASERDRVLREVARQIRRHSPSFVLGRSSREARLFMSWGHRVYREVYVARRSIQFAAGRGPRELIAHWHFQFPVVDLVLRHFRRRLGEQTLVLIDGARVYVHDGCGIRMRHAKRSVGPSHPTGAHPASGFLARDTSGQTAFPLPLGA